MSDYTQAPATKMLATHCCCCGRPLLDAKSVEMGIGPDCAEKHGLDMIVEAAKRDEANALVHAAAIAAQEGQQEKLVEIGDAIKALGFDKLGEIVATRLQEQARKAKIEIVEVGNELVIKTPFRRGMKDEFIAAWRNVPGRKYAGDGANKIPNRPESKQAVLALLKRFFTGEYAVGPKGTFKIA